MVPRHTMLPEDFVVRLGFSVRYRQGGENGWQDVELIGCDSGV